MSGVEGLGFRVAGAECTLYIAGPALPETVWILAGLSWFAVVEVKSSQYDMHIW